MKRYIVFYEHRIYGYYSTPIEAPDMIAALTDFTDNWVYEKIYGIMLER